MNFKKKLLSNLVCAMAVSAATNVFANEVIYKVHDINPVKEDSEVVSCDFSVTFFNRTSEIVSGLSLDIAWLDEVIDEKIKEEKKEPTRDESGKKSGFSGRSQTEKFTSKTISTNLSVPPLPPQKQISLKATIKSDRCFLLMDNPILKVNSCKFGKKENVDSKAGACNNLFVYISPEKGDYYSEFKPISYDDEKKEIEKKNESEKQEMDALYNNAISSVKRISETLETMK